ncbi:MAG: hypothetical protein SWQ30_03320 [Thermodesulfobacteriota bacterium]|nr:hypothetical protein [Thermodesulfobacteriota bacterium]
MEMAAKILTGLVIAGVLGFFVGSVMSNEMVYTLSGCIASLAGFALAIQKGRAEGNKEG